MRSLKRPLATAGVATLLALGLTACGGGAPADASVEDFCDAVQSAGSDEEFSQALVDEDFDKIAELFKEQADKIAEVGTPEDIPDDAREGFEIQLDALEGLSGDDVEEAFNAQSGDDAFTGDLSDDEKDKVEAFTTYQSETCADSAEAPSDVPTESGSDLPTDAPTDVPTDLPSDFPTDLPTDPSELASLLEDLPTELLSDMPTQ